MKHLFCDCCGDQVKAVYPCKFVFPDGREAPLNICLGCMKTGTLEIDLKRLNYITILKKAFEIIHRKGTARERWRKRNEFKKFGDD